MYGSAIVTLVSLTEAGQAFTCLVEAEWSSTGCVPS